MSACDPTPFSFSLVPLCERNALASSDMRPPSWSVSITRGGPNGVSQMSFRPRSNAFVVRLVTISACAYLVH
eukprot:12906996-Prorocentrum_lima.AAC.1